MPAAGLAIQGLIKIGKIECIGILPRIALKKVLFWQAARCNCANLNTPNAELKHVLFVCLLTHLRIFDGYIVVRPEVQ